MVTRRFDLAPSDMVRLSDLTAVEGECSGRCNLFCSAFGCVEVVKGRARNGGKEDEGEEGKAGVNRRSFSRILMSYLGKVTSAALVARERGMREREICWLDIVDP